MKWSWFKLISSGLLISIFCVMQSSSSIAAYSGDGLQTYQQNLSLSPDRKKKLANDINRYRNADNIWDTMRSEFTLPHYEDNPRVKEMIEYFMNNQEQLYQSASRAAPYLYYILEQVRERHLPAEVALLPIFESEYNPMANSSAGASGIWQLMPATASGEGVKQTWWYDGRRDVVASTKAALNHLSYLGNFFDGNWLLAIAAYNTGEGNVLAAMRRNERNGENTTYWNLPLSEQTREYIPKLMALAIIISNPQKYPVQLPYVRNAPYLAQVDVGAQINLKQAAELAGISFKKLQQLNPGFNHAATDPHGPYKLVLPIENVEQFSENLENAPHTAHADYASHRMKRGETLASLASDNNTTIDELKKLNPDLKDHPKTGTNIIIPENTPVIAEKNTPEKAPATPTQVATTQNTSQPAKPAIDKSLNLSLRGHYALQPGDTLYMVRQHDTLQKIAKHFHVNTDTLRAANPDYATLQPGTELVVPTHNKSHTNNYQLEPGDTIYMVRKKDTLATIANHYHISEEQLRVVNLLADNEVKEGDRLVIPSHLSG